MKQLDNWLRTLYDVSMTTTHAHTRTALPASAWGADAARIAARQQEELDFLNDEDGVTGPSTAQIVARAHAIIAAAGLNPATVRPETWFAAACQARNELWAEDLWIEEIHPLTGGGERS